MFMISGTIKQSVKMMQMNNEWLQKKEKAFLKKEKELTPQERQLNMFKEQVKQNQEADKMNGITAKIESGGTLTAEEIDYLKEHNPEALRRYEQMKAEKKAYERQLENCKTKDEVERVKLQKLGGYLAAAKKISSNPCIPKAQKLALLSDIVGKVSNIQKAHLKFVSSARYQELPTDEELAEEKREKIEALTGTDRLKEQGVETTREEEVLRPEEEQEEVVEKMPSSEDVARELTAETGAQQPENLVEDATEQNAASSNASHVQPEQKPQRNKDSISAKPDFDITLHTIQDSIRRLETDTYDQSGERTNLEPQKELGKRIDFRR